MSRKRTKGKILNPSKNNKGYYTAELTFQGKKRNAFVHRLVAENFIENPCNLPQVNHKDGNKENNDASNLEWCTQKENNLHAYKIGLKKITNKHRIASKRNVQIARTYNHKTNDTK